MKTVIDAINDFKGALDKAFVFESLVNKHPWAKGALVDDDENHSPLEFREVCTKEAFESLVCELSTNFGECNMNTMANYMGELSLGNISTAKPQFTKAMADNGELPAIGSEFIPFGNTESSHIKSFNDRVVTVLALTEYNKGVLITFAHSARGVGCGMYDKSWVKAVDNRTKKEKAVDKVLSLTVYKEKQQARAILNQAFDEWMGSR